MSKVILPGTTKQIWVSVTNFGEGGGQLKAGRQTKRDCRFWGGRRPAKGRPTNQKRLRFLGREEASRRPADKQKKTIVFEERGGSAGLQTKRDTKRNYSFLGGRLIKYSSQKKFECLIIFWGSWDPITFTLIWPCKTSKASPKLIWGSLSIAHKKNLSGVPYFGEHDTQ